MAKQVIHLSSLDGNNGFRLDGETAFDFSGKSVSTAGDINGDGLDDLIIGAGLSSYSGDSYVVFGKCSGFAATLDLASLDGRNGFRLDGGEYNLPGHSVSNAGDINGDGLGDVIVGTRKIAADGVISDWCYVLFGKTSSFAASLNVFELDGTDGFRIGDEAQYDSTSYSVSGAGDVNGDGLDDLLIGVPDVSPSGKNLGSSYVVYGKASGFDATLDLSALDSQSGFRIDGAARRDFLGDNVSSAGDVNGDGFDDVLLGASEADPNGIEQAGSSYVLFGGNFTHSVTHPGTSRSDRLLGTAEADRFVSGNGNDSLLGRGGADSFDAGAGDDAIRIGDLTFAAIDGGDGNDALHLAGSGMNLDLTDLGDRIHDIETICLYGRGDNTLTLTAESLLDLSSSTNILKVHGNRGDHIDVQDSGWVDGGSRGFYHTFTHDDAVLLVGANVTVDFV